jgi:DNA polymerase-3 subunit gamma/tau
LDDLWQRILAGLQLPSTRMLLSQQARLKRLDERRAVVRVASTWITMVQSRLPLLEKAMEAALGSPRQITLEASDRDERPDPVAPGQVAPAAVSSAPAALEPIAVPAAPPLPTDPPVTASAPPAAPVAERETEVRETEVRAAAAEARDPAERSPSAKQPLAPPPPTPTTPETQNHPTAQVQPSTGTEERLLEESSTLLADFFNGQVIAMDPQEEP